MNYLQKAQKAAELTRQRIKDGTLVAPKTVEELYALGAKEGWSEERIISYRKQRFPTQADLDAIITV
jgi:hypothetical protein